MRVFYPVRAILFAVCCAVVLTLCGGAPAVAQVPGSRVLVMPFAVDVDPAAPGGAGAALWLGEAASTLITEGLSTHGAAAMSRDQRVAAFDRLNLPMTSALTRATMIRVGELVGASGLVFGNVRLDDRLRIRARFIDLTSGHERPAVEEEGELADIFQVFGRVASGLASRTGRSAAPVAAPAPLALEAFENYLKGLVAPTPAAQQRFLESAVRHAASDPRILMALWSVYTVQGAHERALASANAVQEGEAAYPQARFAVALSMIELRRFDGAWQALTNLHAQRPAAVVSNALGVVQLRRGGSPAGNPAAAYFQRAASEDPGNTDYLFNLGYAHALAQNPAEALRWLREVVRFDAADGDAHQVMSAVLAGSGRPTEAQRELDLARLLGGTEQDTTELVLSSRVPPDLERLAVVADFAAASPLHVATVDPAQRDQRETAMFHLSNAQTMIDARRDREAIAELQRAIYLVPYEERPHRLLGGIYQRMGRAAEAIAQFTVALWCRETVEGRIALGTVLLETGQPDAARREADRALVLAPDSAPARALRARVGG